MKSGVRCHIMGTAQKQLRKMDGELAEGFPLRQVPRIAGNRIFIRELASLASTLKRLSFSPEVVPFGDVRLHERWFDLLCICR
jgi:hypothetical protein